MNNLILCLMCLFMKQFNYCGSFGLIVSVLFGIDAFADFILVSVTFCTVTFRSLEDRILSQSDSSKGLLYFQ